MGCPESSRLRWSRSLGQPPERNKPKPEPRDGFDFPEFYSDQLERCRAGGSAAGNVSLLQHEAALTSLKNVIVRSSSHMASDINRARQGGEVGGAALDLAPFTIPKLVIKQAALDLNDEEALATIDRIRGQFDELLRVTLEIVQPGAFGQDAGSTTYQLPGFHGLPSAGFPRSTLGTRSGKRQLPFPA